MIYFDNAASARSLPEALTAANRVLTENFSNPNALHKGGIEAEKILTASEKTLLNILPKNGFLIFTSGATESANLAILNSAKKRKANKIITTSIEHPCVKNAINRLEADGYKVIRVSPYENKKEIDIAERIIELADEETALISVISVCSETGYIIDAEKIYSEVKSKFPDCLIHLDGAQGFAKVDLKRERADLISVSAHKIGGIAGAGGLYVKNNVRINPMFYGGGQQKGLRSGTQPVALIAAFAEAVKFAPSIESYYPLRDTLINGLTALNLRINGRNLVNGNFVPNIINFSCGVKSEVALHFLAENGIYVSSGSACSKGKKSEILPNFGVPEKDIDAALRISFGYQNTVKEVEEFLNVLETALKRFKK